MGIGRNAEELVRKLETSQFVAEHGDKVCQPIGNQEKKQLHQA